MRFFVLFLVAVAGIIALSFFRPPNIDEEPNELKLSVIVRDPEDDSIDRVVRLEPGVPIDCQTNLNEHVNINVFFNYKGIVQVNTERQDIQISVDSLEGAMMTNDMDAHGRRYGYDFHVNDDGYIAFWPFGGYLGARYVDEYTAFAVGTTPGYEVGREYYATVRAYADPLLDEVTEEVTLKFVRKSMWGDFTIELVE